MKTGGSFLGKSQKNNQAALIYEKFMNKPILLLL